jgi:hypothetical protein
MRKVASRANFFPQLDQLINKCQIFALKKCTQLIATRAWQKFCAKTMVKLVFKNKQLICLSGEKLRLKLKC